jgi:hypothetical protein
MSPAAGTGGTGTAGEAGGGRDGAGAGGTHTGGQTGGGGSSGGTDGAGEFGFSYREPQSHQFSCPNKPEIDVPDMDWLCTFHHDDQLKHVYVQSTATGVTCLLAAFGVYESKVAQISIDGVVSPLADAKYDWGGGHNNDSLTFSYAGKTYKYYHSSFGFGFRKCQPMDCLSTYAPGATTPEIDGCAPRTVPEVCVQIKPGKIHEPLVDKFAKCPGDTK